MRGTATFAQALQSVPETQVSILDNGLRVASEQSSHATCTVSVRYLHGKCVPVLEVRPAVLSQVGM